MSELTNISSEYELMSILQKIGINYFGDELAQERIGMFGFITESFAHMYGALVLDSTIRSKEYSVATAIKRNTLNYAAYKLGIDIPRAKPTNITAYLGLKTEDIANYGTIVSTNPKIYKLVLEKDMTVYIGNYVFKPEFDIEISAMYSTTSESYIYSARYLKEGDTDYTSKNSNDEFYVYPKSNADEDISGRHIPCYRTGNDSKILVFKVDLKQLQKTTTDYVITDTETIALTGIDFEYPEQFSYFNIYYKESDESTWTFMKAVPKYDTNSYEENVIYYEVLDDDKKVRFDFTGFSPKYNSIFRIDIYSTCGSEVNSLNYNGDGADIKIDIISPDNKHTYAGISLACSPLYTSQTGQDTLTIDGMRNYLIKHTSLLNAIITERDISTYLSNTDSINNYYIRKTRSDMVNMIYDVNSKLRTLDSGIIPTRCVDIEAPTNNGVIWSSGEDSLNSNDRYCCPYDLIKTSNGVTVYASNINSKVNMRCIDTDTASTINFRIDHVDIVRNINSDQYKIRVSVMTDGDYGKAVLNSYVNTGSVKKAIILRGFVYSNAQNHVISGIFDFNFVSFSNDVFIFEALLGVSPYVENSDIAINGTTLYNINNVNPGASTINADHEFIINGAAYSNASGSDFVKIDPKKFVFGIGCYYLDYPETNESNRAFLYINGDRLRVHIDNSTSNGYKADTIAIPGSGNAYPKYTGLVEYENGTDNFDYKLCDVYSNITAPVDLYVDMSDIIRIDVEDISGTEYYKDVPCIEYATISSFNDRLHDIMFGTKDLLDTVKFKLLNNFETDYKFYNTSGDSNYFTIGFTDGTNFVSIGDLELTVNVSIGLTDEYATLDTTKLIEIKTAIKKYIEASISDNSTSKIYISNILSKVNSDFSEYIKYIEFDGINGFDSRYRVIKYTPPVNSDTYVSEFISVPISNISVTIE